MTGANTALPFRLHPAIDRALPRRPVRHAVPLGTGYTRVMTPRIIDPGIASALCAALLFGVSTPLAKLLLGHVPPVTLAGLLYFSAGIGLLAWRLLPHMTRAAASHDEAPLSRADLPWLAGAIAAGGVIAPILLLIGLHTTQAATASLLLNLEGVLTAALAWLLFHENINRRVATGMALIATAGVLLSWEGKPELGWPLGAVAIAAACLGWAIDNNLTRHVSAADPVQVAGIKGLVAGTVNLTIAALTGWSRPGAGVIAAAALVGLLGYGISLALFVWALRHIGAARTGAYFSTAPFVGAIAAFVIFPEAPGWLFWAGGGFMLAGVWLHVTEQHAHRHEHEALAHTHPHVHDPHHQHEHDFSWDGREPHTHFHVHRPLIHSHPHYPDLHHRHRH